SGPRHLLVRESAVNVWKRVVARAGHNRARAPKHAVHGAAAPIPSGSAGRCPAVDVNAVAESSVHRVQLPLEVHASSSAENKVGSTPHSDRARLWNRT